MDSTLTRRGIPAAASHQILWRGVFAIPLMTCLMLAACATKHARRDAAMSWDGTTVFSRPPVCDQPYAVTDDLIWLEMQNSQTSVASRKKLNKHVEAIIGQPKAQFRYGGQVLKA